MQTRTTYRQLQPEERMTLAAYARQVRASVSAHALSQTRRIQARAAPRLHPDHVLSGTVLTLLEWKWQPQQIAATLKRVCQEDPTMHVSHETIYTAIYAHPRGELRRQVIPRLRHGRSTRMPRKRGVDRRDQIPEMVSIHLRPPEVEDRLMLSHWDGDFIKGAGNKSAGSSSGARVASRCLSSWTTRWQRPRWRASLPS